MTVKTMLTDVHKEISGSLPLRRGKFTIEYTSSLKISIRVTKNKVMNSQVGEKLSKFFMQCTKSKHIKGTIKIRPKYKNNPL